MKKTTKITDVAERAGVAKSTVSNVLTGKKFVSDELKAKVMQACSELDFHPNFYASRLSNQKSNIVALLLESGSDVEKSFYKELIIACLKEVSLRNYALLIYYNSDVEQLLNTLKQGMAPIDGALVLSPCINDERIRQIESDCIDCVVIGRPESEMELSYVDIDNKKLVKDACEELVKRYGTDIYLINSDFSLTISRDRAESFKVICKEYNIDYDSHISESKLSNEEDGYNYSKGVMRKDGVFITANARLAAGVYRAAEEKGLRVGEDIAVFALGRSLQHGSFTPRLSYAEQDYGILGAKAASFLMDDIENGHTAKRALIESKLIFRESTQRNG